MTARSGADDDDLASILAECDEALAQGSLPALDNAEANSPEQTRLLKSLQCVRVLRGMWRRSHSTLLPTEPRTESRRAAPRKIGRFTIVRELGRGGFGIVYLAIDPAVSRPVALKVPRPDLHLTQQLLDRFNREARAAGGLDHPNIVPVHEAGESDSVAYIATAYCPGMSLARWLEDRKDPVPMRLAADLVAQLADGVAHAHSRNVLHRDIKPANVMLWPPDADSPESADAPVPKITDFGLAKSLIAHQESGLTAVGTILGTPDYLAPEQTETNSGNVGPAVDVYGLGAILYEMLTRRPPFASDSVLETLRQVRYDDPIPPRRHLRAQVPRDLETICLKCLEKAPGRRYPSAAALAADLRRYIRDEPIQARPVSSIERALRWSRRNPLAAGLAAGLILAIVVGVVGVVSQWLRAEDKAERERDARNLAEGARTVALNERDRANANSKRAHDAVMRMTEAGVELYRQPGQQDAGRKIIEQAVTFHESFVADKSDDIEVIKEAAQAWEDVAYYRDQLGQHKAAVEAQRRTVALHDMLLAGNPDIKVRFKRARQIRRLAYYLTLMPQTADSEKAYDDAIAAFRSLCDQDPANIEYKLNLSNSLMNSANLIASDFPRRAQAIYEEALAIDEDCLAVNPNDPWRLSEVALALESLALTIWESDRSPRAFELWQRSANIYRRLVHDVPANSDFPWYAARGRQSGGVILAGLGRTAEAEQEFTAGFDELQKLIDKSPRTVNYRSQMVSGRLQYGEFQRRAGRFKEAEATYRDALNLANSILASNPEEADRLRVDLGVLHANLWLLLASMGRGADAAAYVRQIEEAKKPNARVFSALARVMADAENVNIRDAAQAVRLAQRSVELDAERYDHWLVLGLARMRAGAAKLGIEPLEKAASLRTVYSPEIGLLQAIVFQRIGDAPKAAKSLAEARNWLDKNGNVNSRIPRLLAEATEAIEKTDSR